MGCRGGPGVAGVGTGAVGVGTGVSGVGTEAVGGEGADVVGVKDEVQDIELLRCKQNRCGRTLVD